MTAKLSNYGILGYGVDVRRMAPTAPLVHFTYDDGNTFRFNGEVALPDQFVFDGSPVKRMDDHKFTGLMTTAREYQRSLSARLGVSGIVDGVPFSAAADAANQRFSQSSETSVRMIGEHLASYIILDIQKIDFASALTDEVRLAIDDTGDQETGIWAFFRTYGTHVVDQAAVGGEVHLETTVHLTIEENKEVTENSINLEGEAGAEGAAQIQGKVGFEDRSSSNNKIFNKVSQISHQLAGGNIFAPDRKAWVASLEKSSMLTQGSVSRLRMLTTRGGGAGAIDGASDQYLALVQPKYRPITEVLGLDDTRKKAWDQALKTFLSGKSPFDDKPQRFQVPHPSDARALGDGETANFDMRGWFKTYIPTASLEAKPGTVALVRAVSDSWFDEWTEAKVYAGQTVEIRGKAPYTGTEMRIEVLAITGDDGAQVWARNKPVPW